MKNRIDELNSGEESVYESIQVESCDSVNIDPCSTCTDINLGNLNPTNPGLLVNVFATIRNLCPNRQASVACILCETIGQQDVVRAVQVRQITTSGTSTCVSSNIDFCFAFTQLCNNNDRTFKARIIAHYVNPTGCTCPCSESINNDSSPCSTIEDID
ncbi:hypothetical protein [Clostridium cochlearium]|uniref:hypothetical protein n=1 Tax=Clostridium cochlearium TaxID=1494 RepID=UPI001C0EF64E|nr:hypothetical protein [Clostridium cochlearium]MBU5270546.1 hypothetical protein [Clostridium cochlearium]